MNSLAESAGQDDHNRNRCDCLYIVCMGHSGSTLLEILLNRHPQFVSVGELEKFSLQLWRDDRARYPGMCSCGKRPYDCEFWSPIIAQVDQVHACSLRNEPFSWRMSDVGLEEDLGMRAFSHWLRRKVSRAARYARATRLIPGSSVGIGEPAWLGNRQFLYDQVRRNTGCPIVVDASKDPLSMRDIYLGASGTTKIVFLTRDVRGLVWSGLKRGRSLDRQCKEWVKTNRRIRWLLSVVSPEDWLHVKYENLCAEPVETLAQICRLAGVDHSADMFSHGSGDRHTIGGNSIRHSPVREIKLDNDWEHRLSPDQFDKIRETAGAMAEVLDYHL